LTLKLGYACSWWHPREPTWSYSASRLRTALDAHATVVDIEAQRSLAGKALLRALYAPRPGTPWQYSRPERALMDRAVRRGVRRTRPDAVLGVADVDTLTGVPTFLYQDVNIALDSDIVATTGPEVSNMLPSSNALRARLGAERLDRARSATGLLAASRWYADYLASKGVHRDRIVVVGMGMNNPPATPRDPQQPAAGRILFVGTDFNRKGGGPVVEAVRRLKGAGNHGVRLTVVGPPQWPLRSAVPDFVDFRGTLGAADVARVYAEHDLFVMPSLVEGFGIAFTEALVAGLPCVARRAFAMPEIVDDGVTGLLIDDDDPDTIAGAITRLLEDPDAYTRVAAHRESLLERFSWDSVARRIVGHVRAQLAS
jgi:glycosyltransferase involved in cell wall biosynthesis